MARSKDTVLTARLDATLSQIMEALAKVKPERRLEYISAALELNSLYAFTLKKSNGKMVKYFRDAKA